MRTVILMRHGQAEPYQTDDAARRLTSKGIAEVQSVAEQLLALDLQPGKILASTYQRALQTAELIGGVTGKSSEIEQEALFTPEADPRLAVDYLEAIEAKTTLVACHMPIVSYMLLLLSQGQVQWSFPTAGAAVLVARDQGWHVLKTLQP